MQSLSNFRANSEFLEIFIDRGFFYQATNLHAVDAFVCEAYVSGRSHEVVGYVGFDCTAPSLHVGSLMQIMAMRHFQICGHTPIIILGGATTRIGDPSDKNELRKMLSEEEINKNKKAIRDILERFLDCGAIKNSAIILDNADWWAEIRYIDFLRQYGRYFSVNRMLAFDNIKNRLSRQENLTFLEFNYMLLQAYDFFHLHNRYNCRIEFGGSEQWANILCGTELLHKVRNIEGFGLTTRLVTTKDGVKMGKTVNGAVWLSSHMLSPYEYWQFWRNVDDADVIAFLKLYTELPLSEIQRYEVEYNTWLLKDSDDLSDNDERALELINKLKVLLADHATTICHGAEAAKQAALAAREMFTGDGVSLCIPTYKLSLSELEDMPLYRALSISKLCKSQSEGRKLIAAMGVKVNNILITSETARITKSDFILQNHAANQHDQELGVYTCKLTIGKKRHILLMLTDAAA